MAEYCKRKHKRIDFLHDENAFYTPTGSRIGYVEILNGFQIIDESELERYEPGYQSGEN